MVHILTVSNVLRARNEASFLKQWVKLVARGQGLNGDGAALTFSFEVASKNLRGKRGWTLLFLSFPKTAITTVQRYAPSGSLLCEVQHGLDAS
jgi:hypothetical protein